MEQIFASLDLNLVALLWHSANFVVLVVVLWWLFFRPITRLLDERERRVRDSLARAEEIERLSKTAEADRHALVSDAQRQAAEILARAEEQGRGLVASARAEAREESDRIRRRAVDAQAVPADPASLSDS